MKTKPKRKSSNRGVAFQNPYAFEKFPHLPQTRKKARYLFPEEGSARQEERRGKFERREED